MLTPTRGLYRDPLSSDRGQFPIVVLFTIDGMGWDGMESLVSKSLIASEAI